MIDPAEATVVCPYNKAHVILKSRMQFHLPKCRAQHPNMEKLTCPYNSTHILNYVEMNYHKEHCIDKKVVDSFVYKVGDHNPPPGLQPVRNFVVADETEDWDAEAAPYSVLDEVRNGVLGKSVLVPLIGAPKAERKAHRFNERIRYQQVTSGNPQLKPATGQKQNAVRDDDTVSQLSTQDEVPEVDDEFERNPAPNAQLQGLNPNAADFPAISGKMSALSVSDNENQAQTSGNWAKPTGQNLNGKTPNSEYSASEGQSAAPPSVWGKPILRNRDEKISWPTASAGAPSEPGSGLSPGRNPAPPMTRTPMPTRTPSNPWATNVNRQAEPSSHLAAGPPPKAAASAPSSGPQPGGSTVGGNWGRGRNFNTAQARITSDDFPTLLPVSSRGRKRL